MVPLSYAYYTVIKTCYYAPNINIVNDNNNICTLNIYTMALKVYFK